MQLPLGQSEAFYGGTLAGAACSSTAGHVGQDGVATHPFIKSSRIPPQVATGCKEMKKSREEGDPDEEVGEDHLNYFTQKKYALVA